MIRKATKADYMDLLEVAKHFTEECDWPVTFNPDKASITIWNSIYNTNADLLVSIHDNVLAGVALVSYGRDYFNEYVAEVEKVYVHKEFRKLSIADELVNAITQAALDRRAVMIMASAAAGIADEAVLKLFKRHGFREKGTIIWAKL